MMFDRVIVLSEGRNIYHGPPDHIQSYFEQKPFRYAMGLYSNPADKLITIAVHPRRCIAKSRNPEEDIPLLILESECKKA